MNKKYYYCIYIIIILYVICSRIIYEYDTERFQGMFLTVMQMINKGMINLDFTSLSNLFYVGYNNYEYLPINYYNFIVSISSYPFLIYLFLTMNYLINININQLIIFPFGVLFSPLLYLTLSRRFINHKNDFVYLITLFLLIKNISSSAYGSFYVGPVSHFLQFLFILIFSKTLESNNKKNIFLLIYTFFTILNYWHTPSIQLFFFIISSLFVTNILTNLNRSSNDENAIITKYYHIILSFLIPIIIIFIIFIKFWYGNTIKTFFTFDVINAIQMIYNRLFAKTLYVNPYAYNYKTLLEGKIYFINEIGILLISCLLILMPFMTNAYSNLKRIKEKYLIVIIMSLSLLITQIITTITYTISSSVGFSIIWKYMPLLGLSLLSNIKSKKIEKYAKMLVVLLILLSTSSVIIVELTNNLGNRSLIKYRNIDTSYDFYMNNKNNNYVFLDFNLIGKFSQKEVSQNLIQTEFMHLSTKTYSILHGDSNDGNKYQNTYVFLDIKTMKKQIPINIYENRALFMSNLKKINNNPSHNKLYEDGSISICQYK